MFSPPERFQRHAQRWLRARVIHLTHTHVILLVIALLAVYNLTIAQRLPAKVATSLSPPFRAGSTWSA